MSYNSNSGEQSFTATAGQTEFDFNFKLFQETDIVVYQTLAGQNPDDTNDILILTTDYTVIITGDAGGKVTLNVGAGVNDTLVLRRSLPAIRDTEYQTSGDLLATTLNDDQDYQTYLIADNNLGGSKAITIPDSAVGVNTKIPNVTLDGYIKFNAAGTGVETDATLPQAVVDSSDSALDAGDWANQNENVPVQEFTAGAGADRVPTVYSAKHWAIKAQDAVIGDVEFRDTEWRVFDDLDNTKKVAFQVSGLTTATTRTITMPDTDIDLGDIAENTKKDLSVVVNATSDADITLTATQNQYGRIEITDTGVLLTTARNVIVDNNEHTFLFVNSTAQILTVKTAAGTGIQIPTGGYGRLRNDTVNVISELTYVDDQEGIPYVDTGAIGGSPTASLFPSGKVVGSTDNGDYIRRPDGTLEATGISAGNVLTSVASGNVWNNNIILNTPYSFTTSTTSYANNTFSSGTGWAYVQAITATTTDVKVVSGALNQGVKPEYRRFGTWK